MNDFSSYKFLTPNMNNESPLKSGNKLTGGYKS